METKSAENERMPFFDNIKGILIILVVFAHFLYECGDSPATASIVNAIYTFHMPAFVFISGYFGKSERSQSFQGIIKLAFLFFVFNGITGILYGIDPVTSPNYSMWYLLALIAWRLTAKHIAHFKAVIPVLLGISVFAGVFPDIDNTFAISRIISFYPYYMAGYLLSAEKNAELLKKGAVKRLLSGGGALLAGTALIFAALGILKVTQSDLLMEYYSSQNAPLARCVLFTIGFSMIFAIRNLVPDMKIPFITMFGRNSLWIFLIHRPITIFVFGHMTALSTVLKLLVSAVLTFIVCIVLGNDLIVKPLNAFADGGVKLFTPPVKMNKQTFAASICAAALVLGYAAIIGIRNYNSLFNRLENGDPGHSEFSDSSFESPRVLSDTQSAEFSSAVRITFAGDLILLEDQVKRGFKTDGYDFSELFKYTREHISSADLAIGVFEGPMAGAEAGYSSSNYDDGKDLYLNFPDEFALAVKEAGFDLVTTANNHLLDRGTDGAMRTLDTLDKIGLDHTGSYRNASEKESSRVKFVTVDGIKLAILSYTYGINNYNINSLTDGELSYLTSFVSGTDGELFEGLKARVEDDFAAAKAKEPDLIVVLPHMGTQFSNSADSEQLAWFEIFKENGADIILGDHTHSVQPVCIDKYGDKSVFTLYCPGNYANVYREHQGDTSALVDVYIDRFSKKVIGGGVVPLYTMATVDGNFIPVTTYEIERGTALRSQLSTDDCERAKKAHKTVTRVMLGVEEDISAAEESYLFDRDGYIRRKTTGLILTDEMRSGKLYSAIERAAHVCFIGDSLTEGTKNGGRPWYEPIEEYFPDKHFSNFSKGGATIKNIIDSAPSIPTADLYVIGIGTNDVRYRDASVCAMSASDFTERAEELRKLLTEKNGLAEIIFIAPWYSADGDAAARIGFTEKLRLNEDFSDALESYCSENGLGFINANPLIREKLTRAPESLYLLDWIHPNASRGIIMYSEAALSADI